MRIALAIVAGFFTTVVLALGTDVLLQQFSPILEETATIRLLVLTLAYTLLYAAVGGYVTGRVASLRSLFAVSILTAIAFIVSFVNFFIVSNALPLWWKTASLVLLVPCTLTGGWLAVRRMPGKL